MASTIIKEATLTAHQQLERKVILKLKEIKNDKDYASLLKYFYAYFNSLEKAIAPYITPEVLSDYSQRRNVTYLKEDILALDEDINKLPAATIPKINSTLEAMAALYVMEGSILGGSIIVQMLEKKGIDKGVSFFSGYGADTGRMWRGFLTALDRQASTEQDKAIAIRIANETFTHFSEVFDIPVMI